MRNISLFSEYQLGEVILKNRVVMAPMTRCRAVNGIPNNLMAEYYAQRANAGLIISEGTSPSPNGMGYARMPGIYAQEQIYGWKKVTDQVHDNNGKIFVQLMHTGRVGHLMNLPKGAEIMAPSAIKCKKEKIWTDIIGMQRMPIPETMTLDNIAETVGEYVKASFNAMQADFDGIEFHAANGYLIEQFINPASNRRTDRYGGSIENRSRFLLEVVEKAIPIIGEKRIGVRLSPYGVNNEMMSYYPDIEPTYAYIASELNKLGIAYIHIVDHSNMGSPIVPLSVKKTIRNNFTGTVIMVGNYNKRRAEEDIELGLLDLPAFGRAFISNPDLTDRLGKNLPLTLPNAATFYSADAAGYTDYLSYEEEKSVLQNFITSAKENGNNKE